MDKTKVSLTEQSFEKKIFFYTSLLLFIIYIVLLINTAWLCDDSYITFRTIDNFVNGYGLRWNIAERVQSFTHPLWLFLLSLFYFFTREIFFTSIVTSMVLSLAAVFILSFRLPITTKNKIIVLLAIIFSKAFIDYSTSGLENPLTNLLIVLFAYTYFKLETGKTKTFLLTFILALIMVNRMDCVLLLLPAYAYYIIKNNAYKNYYLILLGFSIFIIWELFSLLYYGFLFPNTAYAKLNTGIPRFELVIQGFKYFYSSFKLDPITLVLIFLLLILTLVKFNRKYLSFSIGIFFYLIYTISVGGDFMAGRFFSASFLVALIILSQIEINTKPELISFILIIILAGSISLKNTLFIKYASVDKFGICDERVFYYQYSNFIDGVKGKSMPSFIWVDMGKAEKRNGTQYIIMPNIGFFGFFAGNQSYILDPSALSDPLLSKHPCIFPWRIGHYERRIPLGYRETLVSGKNEIRNPALAKYYDKILLITRAPLWSKKRLLEIWKTNTGQYDYLINDFLKSEEYED